MNVTEKNIPMIHAALATTRDYLKIHPDQTRRFLQAYLEGIKIALTDAEFAKQMIAQIHQDKRSGRSRKAPTKLFYPLGNACRSSRLRQYKPCLISLRIRTRKQQSRNRLSITRYSANSVSQDSSISCINNFPVDGDYHGTAELQPARTA